MIVRGRKGRVRRPVLLSRGIFLITFAGAVSAQPNPCDPQLLQAPGNANGYRLRGDRCEGLYVQQVAGIPLVISSWTQSVEDYDASNGKPLVIEWETPGGGAIRLRAKGLRRRLYYRMDALAPARSDSYRWPTSLLSALGVSKADLGVTGLVRVQVDKIERDVYLPVTVRQQGSAGRGNQYELILMPEVELKELYLTLGPVGKSALIKDGEALNYGYYPAGRPIQAPVTGVKARGIYRLQIGATLKSGGSATTELWFYHPGL